ncbi:MAG: hypothetical protein U5L72_17740 [Bacteroidales bacterium]|nr:hypothetical protein [Bacteroidales bacterium]
MRTTIDPALQKEVAELVNRHQAALEGNMIHNAAALVVEVGSGHVVAYAGNSTLSDTTGRHGRDVDMIMAPRRHEQHHETVSLRGAALFGHDAAQRSGGQHPHTVPGVSSETPTSPTAARCLRVTP